MISLQTAKFKRNAAEKLHLGSSGGCSGHVGSCSSRGNGHCLLVFVDALFAPKIGTLIQRCGQSGTLA